MFLLLWLPFNRIGFDSDCCGLVWFCSQISWKELFGHMLSPIQYVYLPPNELISYQNSFFTYFRPGMLFFQYLAYQLFGQNPYAYHGITVFWHTLAGIFLYLLLSRKYEINRALLLSLTALLHPALTPAYVGATSHVAPTYPLLAAALFFYVITKKEKSRFHLSSALCFFGSLLCYELALPLPLLLTVYEYSFFSSPSAPLKEKIIFALQRTSSLWFTAFLYLTFRAALLGVPFYSPTAAIKCTAPETKTIASSSIPSTFAVSTFVKKIIHNTRQAIRPLWGCPQGSPFIPALATALFFLLFIFTIKKSPALRKELSWYAFAFIAASWPAALVTADGRYFYAGIPFFILSIYEMLQALAQWLKTKYALPQLSYFPTIALLVLSLWYASHAIQALQLRQTILSMRDQAFDQLAQELSSDLTHQSPQRIIFLGTVHYFCGDTLIMQQGMTQKARLAGITAPILFHCTQAQLFITQPTIHPYAIHSQENPDKSLEITFSFPSPEECSLMIPPHWAPEIPYAHSMGTVIVHEKYKPWLASAITFILDPHWITPQTKVFAFDYVQKCFRCVASSHATK